MRNALLGFNVALRTRQTLNRSRCKLKSLYECTSIRETANYEVLHNLYAPPDTCTYLLPYLLTYWITELSPSWGAANLYIYIDYPPFILYAMKLWIFREWYKLWCNGKGVDVQAYSEWIWLKFHPITEYFHSFFFFCPEKCLHLPMRMLLLFIHSPRLFILSPHAMLYSIWSSKSIIKEPRNLSAQVAKLVQYNTIHSWISLLRPFFRSRTLQKSQDCL
jgi:hypothetical protein